ncbi:MAG: transaldolase [Dehalococcoidia bacterium]|nr:transaldolase [Dehalococcoidia bacterium]
MDIFLDTADQQQVRRWMDYGVVDGVTTNPTIMRRNGVGDIERHSRELARLIDPRPLSVEVTTNDHDEMLREARVLAKLASNIVVKIPVINEQGLPSLAVIRQLSEERVRVNVTAIMSFGQVMLAAKAGATYVSIFAGRVADEGGDAAAVIRRSAAWLARWNTPARIIVGSVREPANVQDAAEAGAHIITIPPALLEKLIDHRYSRDTVRGFNEDARAALAESALRAST